MRTTTLAVAAACLLSACSGDPAPDRPAIVTPVPSAEGSPFARACPELAPLVPIPDAFPDVPLPPRAVSIEPPARPKKGVRVDLFVRSPVRWVHNFYKRYVRERDHTLVFTDYEGFEAELYFRFRSGRLGLVRIFRSCAGGSVVAFEVIDR